MTQQIQSYTNTLNRALDKLKPFSGTTYRGTDLTDNQIQKYIDAAKSKRAVKEKAFTSTSISRDTAEEYGQNKVLFIIQSKTGRNIEKLSKYGDGEKEILFKSGTVFRVTEVRQYETGTKQYPKKVILSNWKKSNH